ncbi:type III pantothenate kinase [Flavobacterium columnare]|uniref:Type III pantothenate kinase n=1 Tax=Flavobacterium columnare TaxID=996 RepID=A0AAI8CIU9_9FLAO|nr:type III pantothenate kinase [Flavobacterium columnare]AMO20827.1 type III pantothenate kinase [Flavobacterium columnare]AUX18817.1 type III pantothenate kinase [Flavobacterium columnare]QOG57903.1 type III pantothenate kinase [Flavobacterium columnare]QOG60626.1 type III pantothenate kinase [Flavobacterium columnare]QOG63345.1 type III pantothenate kinase [Flavobacterium columnare]
MVLVVDIGNTRVKVAVIEKDMFLELVSFSLEKILSEMEFFLEKYPLCKDLILSSVGKLEKKQIVWLQKKWNVVQISRESKFPFLNQYATPNTLGVDRMVLAAGAVLQFPFQNRLIIDVGTCVTYDFVDEYNVYHGGAISPGFRLRYASMHNYTAQLPLLELNEPEDLVGNSSISSMHSGVVNGLSFEIDGYIDELKKDKEKFIIILTGGDANFLAKRLKNTIFANSNFLLESLNHIYQYQIQCLEK